MAPTGRVESGAVRAYYFGCWLHPGHFFFEPGMKRAPREVARSRHSSDRDQPQIVPWGYGVDGQLCPRRGRQGEALVHHRDGWTALAFWDRSVDDRGGSNSVFLFEATLDFPAALAKARETFPEVFARFDFDVVPA